MSAGNSMSQYPTECCRTRRTSVITSVNGKSTSQKRIGRLILALLALLLGLWSVTPSGQSVMPVPKAAFYDNNGNPCAGCLLHAYVAGTTTNQNTYADTALTTPNANPVVLDSAGRATVFTDQTLSYKFTLSTAADVPIWTVDVVSGQLFGIVTINAANARALRITRTSADAGLSIASVGGAGKTYGIVSTTAGTLVIQDDADATPQIAINAGDQITLTATSGVLITGPLTLTGLATLGSASVTGTSTLAGPVVLSSVLTPTQITADQNNYSPTGLGNTFHLRLSSDASRTITGIATGAAGRLLWVRNVGAQNIVLAHESASSTAANRFAFNAGSDRTLTPGGQFLLYYDATSSRWITLSAPLG